MSNALKLEDGNETSNLVVMPGGHDDSLLGLVKQTQMICEMGTNGEILTANEALCKAVGYSADELQGKNIADICDPNFVNSAEYKDSWKKLLAGKHQVVEYKLVSKAGKELWFISNCNCLVDRDGKVTRIVQFSTDVTASRAELKTRIDIMNMTSIVSEGDLRGDILSVNEKFCETSQYSREELVGKGHNTTRHPDMPKEVFKQMWSTIGRGQIFRGIVKNRKKDGNPYYVDAVIAPIMGDNGKPRKYLGVRYDITEMEIERQNMKAIFSAINSSYAYIEFDIEGRVLTANKNFLSVMKYELDEIVGKHHKQFVDPNFASSVTYSQFWTELKAGKAQSDTFKRITKGGKEVWIQAIYSPVTDEMGRVTKFIKIATDVTEQMNKANDNAGQLAAISRAQAVIEFNLDGTISHANENFLKTLNYDISDIKGKHHSMFCDPTYAKSSEYRAFWEKLNRGEYEAGEFKRFGRGGKEVWINASYTPILDANNKPYKVVKFATDITHVKMMIRSIEETANILAGSSSELTATATQMSAAAQSTSRESEVAAAAAEEVAAGVQTVATNTEEMVASIKEIARSTTESSNMAKTTMQRAVETNKTITQLGVSSQEIGDVIKVISSIAQQTNLLALNATIEAARAGEAGRGFAVVANEVKELAKQTAKATHEITNKIGAIQKDTQGAVDAISGISQAVEKLNNISGVIAAAVEEQTATASEVSRVVVEARKGVEAIATTIKTVSKASGENAASSEQTLMASKELSQLAERLTAIVKR